MVVVTGSGTHGGGGGGSGTHGGGGGGGSGTHGGGGGGGGWEWPDALSCHYQPSPCTLMSLPATPMHSHVTTMEH